MIFMIHFECPQFKTNGGKILNANCIGIMGGQCQTIA